MRYDVKFRRSGSFLFHFWYGKLAVPDKVSDQVTEIISGVADTVVILKKTKDAYKNAIEKNLIEAQVT
jgi:hypothetical protein